MGRDDDSGSSGYWGGTGGDPYSKEHAMGRELRQHHDSTLASMRASMRASDERLNAASRASGPAEPFSFTKSVFAVLAICLCWQVGAALNAVGVSVWLVFGVPIGLLMGLVAVSRHRLFKRYARIALFLAVAGFFLLPGVRDALLTGLIWLNPMS
ncbi:MAG: hypothetical protein AAF667_06920 [Pseudomonadota bacterium]